MGRSRGAMWQAVLLSACMVLTSFGSSEVLDIGNDFEGFTSFMQLGEQMRKDGCSEAYSKFESGVKRLEGLKDVAVKKQQEAEQKAKQLEAETKHCKDSQKEVLAKADWKKEKINAEIKKQVDAKVNGDKKEVKKEEEKKEEKKVEETKEEAEKKVEKAEEKDKELVKKV